MTTGRGAPDWFDRQGMVPWVEGTAAAFRCRIALLAADGRTLVEAGEGSGEALRLGFEVNGRPAGEVVAQPAERVRRGEHLLRLAVRNLQSLAEARHTVTDLVRTTARQWRELSLLYRSTELLRGGLGAEEIAADLLERALKALHSPRGAVLHPAESGEMAVRHREEGGLEPLPEALLHWAASLEKGVVVEGEEHLRELGYHGPTPQHGVVAIPLVSGGRSFGALVLGAGQGSPPSSEHLKLAGLLGRQAAVAFENRELVEAARRAERLRHELELASSIQGSILPPPRLELEWVELAAACRPAAAVGGDAYLHRAVPGRGLCAGVADVSGHGISAALLMNAFATAVLAFGGEDTTLAQVAGSVNDLLAERLGDSGMFVTAALLRLSQDGHLSLVNAGHPPVLLRRGGRIEPVEADDPPFGIVGGARFRELEAVLDPGAHLVLYSDGVTESASEGGGLFGVERLATLVEGLPADLPAAGVVDAILREVDRHTGPAGPSDDVTVLVLRRRP